MNWVVVLNLWSYKSCLYNQVSLHWNLHVKQPLIGKLVINQIRCHCLTMTRFMGKQRQLSLPFSILLNYYLTIYPCQWMDGALWGLRRFIYNPVLNSKDIEEKFQRGGGIPNDQTKRSLIYQNDNVLKMKNRKSNRINVRAKIASVS